MRISSSSLFTLVVAVANGYHHPMMASAQECPPPGLDALGNLDLASYISAPWYILKQIPVVYQPPSDLFCVRAEYAVAPSDPIPCRLAPNLCPDEAGFITVMNTSNSGSVNGRQISADLKGIETLPTGTGRFRVGLSYTPNNIWGDYFIMAAGSYEDLFALEVAELAQEPASTNYDWVIVTSGLPEVSTGNGCLPGTGRTNLDGFWLFSRLPVVDPEVTSKIEEVADFLGLDTSALLEVVQEGCTY